MRSPCVSRRSRTRAITRIPSFIRSPRRTDRIRALWNGFRREAATCRALRRPVLKPRVLAAIDLNQFANARAPRPRLLDLRRPQPSRQPQAAGGHERPDGLDRQIDAMAFSELLGRQCRPKIAVLAFDNGEGFFSALRLQTSITRPVPELGDQTS
jgi:hypothetical protein